MSALDDLITPCFILNITGIQPRVKNQLDFIGERPFPTFNIIIPDKFFEVRYLGSRIPGVDNPSDFSLGANCQLFAYELLKENGLEVPNLRSSDLWEDVIYTETVDIIKPLDLMLYNRNDDPFGAHVGVYIGDGNIIHLSFLNKTAAIIQHKSMHENKKYSIFIGAKRIKKR